MRLGSSSTATISVNKVSNIRSGNHVEDWEHTCIRFDNGKPKAMFLSEHDIGAAYAWEAMEKIGKRPVIYSATGTYANYTTPGVHIYVLLFGLLHDITDRGPLCSPTPPVAELTSSERAFPTCSPRRTISTPGVSLRIDWAIRL